jgi:small-conductance mechanosensitive channel
MTSSNQDSDQEILRGRPWILLYAGVRTILVAVIAIVALVVEISMGYLYVSSYGSVVLVWTLLAFFIIWILVDIQLTCLEIH